MLVIGPLLFDVRGKPQLARACKTVGDGRCRCP